MKRHLYKLLGLIILLIALRNGVAAQSDADEGAADSVRTGVISGRVVTENGQPMENVAVTVRAWNVPAQQGTATSDGQGRFQVSGLEPALYLVSASSHAYISLPRESGGQPSYYRIGDSVTLTLIKGGVITGTVTSASGEPLVMTGVTATMIRDLGGQKSAVLQSERTTDDRGVYRLYGLPPGTYVISTGGRSAFNSYGNAYDTDVPTYAPSSTRDSAVEINVRAGEERASVDIRYRPEPGHVVSGTVDGPSAPTGIYSGAAVFLTQVSNGTRFSGLRASQAPGSRGFLFNGVGDGDYELAALSGLDANGIAVSEPRRISVKGADVTGLQLITKPLGSISGHLVLESSNASECKGKRRPLFTETLVLIQNNSNEPARDDPRAIWFARQVTPDKSGDVLFANLGAGQYRFGIQFSAKYWYLKAITQPPVTATTLVARSGPTTRPVDAARNWISVKQGERLSDLTFSLAEGAGSLRGSIKLAEGQRIPAQLYVHLVPSEKENAEDVLRYFAIPVSDEATFALGNLPAGRYWILARTDEGDGAKWPSKLRLPDESELRTKLRKQAEAAKTEIEVRPCQNVMNYSLPFK
ncbi:MAG: carboxypeptidase-like regulatory domain-containing protein [bacterium]